MSRTLRFLPDIPNGYQIFGHEEEVFGIQHRLSQALAFAYGSGHWLSFEPEPGNRHDQNAIKVNGHFRRWFFQRTAHVGYVHAPTAKKLVESGLAYRALPQLKSIWCGGDEGTFVIIRFDILLPKECFPHRHK
jgi:hypothetical protein